MKQNQDYTRSTTKNIVKAKCLAMRKDITVTQLLNCQEFSGMQTRLKNCAEVIKAHLRELMVECVLVYGEGDTRRKRVYAINPQYRERTAPTPPKARTAPNPPKARTAQKPAKCDVVPPRQYNIFRAPPYVSEANYAMRPGAMDFKDVQSVGF